MIKLTSLNSDDEFKKLLKLKKIHNNYFTVYFGKIYSSITNNGLKISPNPLIEFAMLEFDNNKLESYNLTLYNYLGELVRSVNNITDNNFVFIIIIGK